MSDTVFVAHLNNEGETTIVGVYRHKADALRPLFTELVAQGYIQDSEGQITRQFRQENWLNFILQDDPNFHESWDCDVTEIHVSS